MEVHNEAELRVLNKMEALNFPRSITTTVIWATRKAPNSTEALREVELLIDQKPTGKEMTRAVQKYLKEPISKPNISEELNEEKLWAGFNRVARRVKAYIDAGGTLETIDERDRAALRWYWDEIFKGYEETPMQRSPGWTHCVFTGTQEMKYILDELHNMCLPKGAVTAIMWALDRPQNGEATYKEIKDLFARGATIKKIIETSEKAHP